MRLFRVLAMLLAVSSATSADGQVSDQIPNAKARQIQVCQDRWSAADKNGDGWLDQGEIDAASALLPKTIVSPASVSQRQFLDACIKSQQGKGD